MNLAELIENQFKDIKQIQREAQRVTRTAEDLALPAQVLNARIARIEARIKDLQAQREDTVKRLEGAIAEQTELRERLVKEARGWADRQITEGTTPAPTPRPSTPGLTRVEPKRTVPTGRAAKAEPRTKAAVTSTAGATRKAASKARAKPRKTTGPATKK